MSDDDTELVVDDIDHVRVLRLNRPQRRNALSRSLLASIRETALRTASERDVWVVVVTGTGSDAFCAGADLKETHERNLAGDTAAASSGPTGAFEAVLALPMPTIAAINGAAVAGGLELALACDIRVCSSAARLGMPEVARGLVGNFASTLLPRLIPPSYANEMLFTAQPVDAETALRIGLVSRVFAPDELLAGAMALAADIVANAPMAVHRTKARSRVGALLPTEVAYRLDLGPDPRDSADRREGVAAFVEKRAPRWTNS